MVGFWNSRFSRSSNKLYWHCSPEAEYTIVHFIAIAFILCINVKAFNDLIDNTDQ